MERLLLFAAAIDWTLRIQDTGSMSNTPPPARGTRLEWSQLPQDVRDAIEQRLGSPVVTATTQRGGFSPGLAARVQTLDGQRAFVKAVSPERNLQAVDIYRREAAIAARLPAEAPVTRLLWVHDEGPGGWVALAFEDIDGRQPELPWQEPELNQVLDALVALGSTLTPSPVAENVAGRASTSGVFTARWWQRLLDAPPPGLDPWSARHLVKLSELEERASSAVEGDTLVHLDLRADNMLIAPDGIVIFDWAHACIGAAWVDVIAFAPSVVMQGGPPAEHLLQRHPASHAADPDDITATIVAVAGFFTWSALQAPPSGLPTLRAFQAAQGVVARQWVAQRTDWR
jgi:aminoglycoside phosphotransferase (APT) family kinase protein